MNRDNFAAVILAAGYSSRMGDFKPLLKFGEYTALETIINTFTTSGICNIIVVVGHRGNEIIDVLKGSQVKCIDNKNYFQGMYSSVLKGIEILKEDVNAFFMLPVDIPLVKVHTIETLKSQYLCCDKGIIYPTFNGKRGHPPLIDCKYKDIIVKTNEDGGLKNILSKFDEDSLNVPVFDKFTTMDMDTKSDYMELLKYSNLRVPNREECYSILKMHDVPENVIRHCTKVSEVAIYILNILNKKGYNFDEDLLSAAALLHDIDRKSINHAKKGEETLKKLGYEHIGNIISTHMDIKVSEKENITENEILYLADKLVKEDKVIPLECRFDHCLLKHKNDFDAKDKIKQRYIEAKKVISKIESVIGKSFDYE